MQRRILSSWKQHYNVLPKMHGLQSGITPQPFQNSATLTGKFVDNDINPIYYPVRSFHTSDMLRNKQHNDNSDKGAQSKGYLGKALVLGGVLGGGYKAIEELQKKQQERMKTLCKELDEYAEECSNNYLLSLGKVEGDRKCKLYEELLNNFFQSSLKDWTIGERLTRLVPDIVVGNPLFHLQRNGLDSKYSVYLLHITNSVANYYMFKLHDGKKARGLLLKAKEATEHYLQKHYVALRNKKLDDLTPEEQHEWLKKIDGLPEIYCATLYFLGRSYVYVGDLDVSKDAEKYFETSKYLGKECQTFQAVLSLRQGFSRIADYEIEKMLKRGKDTDCRKAKKQIDKMVIEFEKLKAIDSELIESYKPHVSTKGQKRINLATDLHHRAECNQQLLKYHNQALALSENEKILEHLASISDLLVGENGLFDSIAQIEQQLKTGAADGLHRKLATAYNNMGNFMIVLNEKLSDQTSDQTLNVEIKEQIEEIQTKIVKKLDLEKKFAVDINFDKKTTINLAQELFKLAIEQNPHSTDFTKAVAQGGLTYCLKTQGKDHYSVQSEQDEITINDQLNRKQHDSYMIFQSCCFKKSGAEGLDDGDKILIGQDAVEDTT